MLISKNKNILDRVGATGSTLCVIHCFISAFLPGFLAVLGVGAVLNNQFEWGFTIFAAFFAGLALWSGYKKHKSTAVLLAFVLGISGLLLSRVIEQSAHGHHEEGVVTQAHSPSESSTEIVGAQGHDHHEEGAIDWHLIGTLIGIGAGASIIYAHLKSMKLSQSINRRVLSV